MLRTHNMAVAAALAVSFLIGNEAWASVSGRGGGVQASPGACPADCDENNVVVLDELVGVVRIALGQRPLAECEPADGDGDQRVGVTDLVSAVNAALGVCPPLAVNGRCMQPGPSDLVPCDVGREVRVLSCHDPERCLTNPDEPTAVLATTQVSAEGRFAVSFPSAGVGHEALIVEVQVNDTTTYRTITFAGSGSGGGSGLGGEEILIGPSSEAAVRLMAESDFASFSPEEVADLLAAVEVANKDTDFSNLAPEAAASRATAVASEDPDVMMIIEEAQHTPTTTSTSTPSATATVSKTPTNTPTATPTPTTPNPGALRVTKTEDSNDGVCDADCSLREAIAAADANPGPDEISVPAGTYRLTVASSGRTRLFLTTDVNIVGAGRNLTFIDGNDTGSVFAVQSATVRIADLTVTNGTADLDDGGGIFNAGTLTLERVSVANNIAVRFGGGIFNSESDSLTLLDSVVTQNRADRGGGIYNDVSATLDLVDSTIGLNNASRGGGVNNAANAPDSMTVNRCTIYLNGVTGDGGGVYGQGTFVNATISGNVANGSGGGIFASPGTTLSNVTVTDNFAAIRGGGLSGTATIANTLIAGNGGGGNCDHTLTSLGHNLVAIGSSSSGCELDPVGPGDITADVDPLLGRLADNGGPTMTHAPLDDSPAVDAGDPSPPGSSEAACASIDQRGITRPQGSACDIGAYEAVQGGGGALAVTKTQDSNDGVCDADCSLREAVAVANGRFGEDQITLPAGTYVLTLGPQGSTALVISGNLSISGAGAEQTILDGFQITRVLSIGEDHVVRISDLTVRNGFGQDGAGISNQGTLALERVVVSDNGSISGRGGGILNLGTLTVLDSIITRNTVGTLGGGNQGGGISNSGALTVMGSTISFNRVTQNGRGAGVDGAGTFINCTISNNIAEGTLSEGGGLYGGPFVLNNVTIAANSAATASGLYGAVPGSLASNTLIAGSIGGNAGELTSLGRHNLIADDVTDPGLGPLANNGGPTMTHALLDGSRAINAGDPAVPGSGGGACEATDQRGVGRPRQGRCDIGAFESDLLAPPFEGICATASEGELLTLQCPAGVILAIEFASYGTPSGTCGEFSTGECHSDDSFEVVFAECAGLSNCSIPVNNDLFGDPCFGEGKSLYVQAQCGTSGEPTPTLTPTQLSNGANCTDPQRCTSGNCVNGICCTVAACAVDEFCAPLTGECTSGPTPTTPPTTTPTPTATRVTRDERSQTDPTDWWWTTGATAQQVGDLLGQHEARLVNIEVESVSPLLFTAVMVANQGAYGKEWYWYFGVSDAQLNELSLGRRIIDLETYESGGQRLFAAVLVANTGSEEKEWGWYYDVAAGGVDNLSEAQGFRIIDLETYLASGQLRFAFVMVKNVGADQRGWNWDYGSSVAEIQSLADSGRFIDLENDPQGGYSTVRVDCPCPRWWYYTGVTEGDVDALAAENGARPIAIEPYTAPALGKRFNVIMLDNTAPGTATPTVLPSPTPTTILDQLCATCCEYYLNNCPAEGCGVCDADGDGHITVGELLILGCSPAAQCPE